ncbi:BPSL0761 family protein [Paraburkholderia caballeronis]|uniref:BPSL0761 family protein n=2 Tax=Paraburkholderia caballeronis TaxID=416943 RepID=UPI003138DA9A
MMTIPTERTKAVLDTRDFLKILSNAEEVTIPGLVQSVATSLLRHYPLVVDLDISASVLPSIWASPLTLERDEKGVARALRATFRTSTDRK